MLPDLRRAAPRARSIQNKRKARWRLWPCLAVALLACAGLATSAQAATNTFSNANPIAIPGTGTGPAVANPYPSIIRLSGFTGQITNVDVRFENLTHTFPDDIDALLVGPGGQSVLLMSDTGGSNDINVDLTFSDTTTTSLPDNTQILSGTYRPTNFGGADTFPSPAPPPPFGATLAGFNNTSPNGDWRLFVYDDAGADLGTMAGGWSLTVTTPANAGQGQPGTGPGRQTLRRGACTNPQRGTNGNDVLVGTRAGDRLSGHGGNDVLRGLRGRDCLSGGTGNDRLSGGPGNDRLSGGPGNDRLNGGSGRNRYAGGSGRDSINSRNGRRETVNCGSGRDRVRADGFDRLRSCEVVL
jgi:Ca2+-binding RTX toxin-like protein